MRKEQRGGRSNEEEGATRRKEQRGGRSDEEKMKKLQRKKDEKCGLRTHR